eukprot:10781492-Karenia_brevis.AAC.1
MQYQWNLTVYPMTLLMHGISGGTTNSIAGNMFSHTSTIQQCPLDPVCVPSSSSIQERSANI